MLRPRSLLLAAPLSAVIAVSADAAAQQPVPEYQQPPPQYAPPPQYQQPPPQYAPPPQYQQPQYAPAPAPVYQQQYPPPVYTPGPVYQAQQPVYVQQAPQLPQGPRIIKDWDSSQPIPPGYHKEEHARKGLIIGGAVLFGTTYLLSALTGALANDLGGSATGLFIPAIGPFVQMGQGGTATGEFLLAFDGILQCGGIVMFGLGLGYPSTELVRNDFGFSLHLQPMLGPSQQGMGLGGTF
jgi:hypothetical protein